MISHQNMINKRYQLLTRLRSAMHNRWNLINYREQHIAVRRAVVIAQMNATRAQNYAPQDSTRHAVRRWFAALNQFINVHFANNMCLKHLLHAETGAKISATELVANLLWKIMKWSGKFYFWVFRRTQRRFCGAASIFGARTGRDFAWFSFLPPKRSGDSAATLTEALQVKSRPRCTGHGRERW